MVKLTLRTNNSTFHASEEKNDIQRARDTFRAHDIAQGEAAKIATSDEFITATGRMMEGKVWCKLSTMLRCSGEEALSYLLDATSRSLLSERDVVVEDDEKGIFEDEGHTRTVQIVEEITGVGGARFNNKIVRKLVWERKNYVRTKSEAESIMYGSPTTIEVENAPSLFKLISKPLSKQLSSTGIHNVVRRNGRRQSSTILEMRTDNSIIAVNIMQINEEESTIDVLVDTPKKHRKREKMNTLFFFLVLTRRGK